MRIENFDRANFQFSIFNSPLSIFQLFKASDKNRRQRDRVALVALAVNDVDGVNDLVVRIAGENFIATIVKWVGENAAGIVNHHRNLAFDAVGGTEFWHERNAPFCHIAIPAVGDENIADRIFLTNIPIAIREAEGDVRGVGSNATRKCILGHADVLDGWDERVFRWRYAAENGGQCEAKNGEIVE